MLSVERVTVHCIGNAHLDPVWRWGWEENYAETLATCRAAVDRLRDSDDFIFTRGEAATLAWIEETAPDLFEEIRKYVAEGRWHIVGGWWEQPDCNLPAGESYVRQALYGKRWFREKLGVEVRTGWNPDSFGHNGGLPQILARSGYEAYCFFRPDAQEKALPSPFFWWQGRDGSRVLGIRPPTGHYSEWQDDLSDLVRRAAEEARALGLAHAIVCYGVGNHGGGPTKKSIASLRALRDDPAQPKAIFSTIVLFNPFSWQRTDAVTVQWGWPSQQGNRLLDESGADIPFQLGKPDVFPAGSRIQFAATLPAHGHRVYRLVPSNDGFPVEAAASDGPRVVAPASLENRLYRIDVDPESGHVTRILDKRYGVEVLRAPACELVVLEDPGDTWGHGIRAWRSELGRFRSPEIRMLEDGPARATLRIDTRWRHSTARQEISLHRDNPRIDVALSIDWHERHQMLKLSVPVAGGTLSFAAPYSAIERPMTGREEPGQTWIDLTGTATKVSGTELRYGVSLLNDAKFGFDCLDGDLRMSLLRSPIYCFHEPAQMEPDQEYLFLDQGMQTLRYALLPHVGDWEDIPARTGGACW